MFRTESEVWRHMSERMMMEAVQLLQGVSQATTVSVALQNTMAVGSTPAPSLQRSEQQKLEETAVENQAEDEVENHVEEANEPQDQRRRFRW